MDCISTYLKLIENNSVQFIVLAYMPIIYDTDKLSLPTLSEYTSWHLPEKNSTNWLPWRPTFMVIRQNRL